MNDDLQRMMRGLGKLALIALIVAVILGIFFSVMWLIIEGPLWANIVTWITFFLCIAYIMGDD